MTVSIVIPAYNAAGSLPRLLTSLSRQTLRPYEVIVVDDGSTDATRELLSGWQAPFDLHVISQANAGVSVARNVGLRQVKGDAVLFADADDALHPNLLEWAVAALDESTADFVMIDYKTVPENYMARVTADWQPEATRPVVERLEVPAFDWFVDSRRLPAPWQFLFRRQSLPDAPFDPDIRIYEDVPFVLGYLARPLQGVWMRKEVYAYSVQERSQSHHSPILARLAGLEAGMRVMRRQLDDRQYRVYARGKCASWVMDMWRETGKLPTGEERDRLRMAMCEFVSRSLKADQLRWSDFRASRRLRIVWMLAVKWWRGG